MSFCSNKSKNLNLSFLGTNLWSLLLILFLGSSIAHLRALESGSGDASSKPKLSRIEKIINTGDLVKLGAILQAHQGASEQNIRELEFGLIKAIKSEHPRALAMVQMLLHSAGLNLNNIRDSSRHGVLSIACASNGAQALEIVALLLDGGATLKVGTFMTTAVSLSNQAPEIMELLISRGGADLKAMLDTKNRKGETALMLASQSLNARASEIANMLLAAGAELHLMDQGNWTPLMLAAASQSVAAPKIVDLLLAYGEDRYVNQVNINGHTALMLAASSKSVHAVPIVAQLVQIPGIDIDVANRCGYTALFLAVMAGNANATELVYQLLAAGSNPDVMVNNTVVLDFAIKSANLAMVLTLLEHGASPYSSSKLVDRLITDYQGEVYYQPEAIGKVRHEIALAILNQRAELQAIKLAADESKRQLEAKAEPERKRRRNNGGDDTDGAGGAGGGSGSGVRSVIV